tara:strand:+ start:1325 stop:4132 length:2808 start_codon:yes stop_codon:yes gene_type:complete
MLIYLLSHQPDAIKSSKVDPRGKKTKVHKLLGKYTPENLISIAATPKRSGKPAIYPHLFNLETQKITALVPELRFRKVFGGTGRFQPFYLPITSDFNSEYRAASAKGKTAGAVGVRTFSVKTEGTDPFTAPKYLTANLEIFVDQLDNIFNPPPGYAPLADLFTLSIAGQTNTKSSVGGVPVTGNELARPIEIEATLGYTISDDRRDIFTQEEIDEIIATRQTLRMNVFNHSINVNQDGTATISIDYTARVNTIRSSIYSVVSSVEEVIREADIRTLADDSKKESSPSQVPSNASAESEAELQRTQSAKASEAGAILAYAESRGKLLSVTVSPKEMEKFSTFHLTKEQLLYMKNWSTLTTTEIKRAKKTPTKTAEQTIRLLKQGKTLQERLNAFDNSKREIHYIFFGDLVESFFERYVQTLNESIEIVRRAAAGNNLPTHLTIEHHFYEKLKKKTQKERDKIIKVLEESRLNLTRYRVMLSNVTYKYVKPEGGGPNGDVGATTVNIADVPISLELYQKYMYDKIYTKDRSTYTLSEFLKDCHQELLPKAFGESYWATSDIAPRILKTRPVFTSSTFSATHLRGEISNNVKVNIEKMPAPLRDKEPLRIDDECDYLFIYQSPDKQNSSGRRGLQWEDIKAGIYHFLIGKNRGLIKEINFSRFDVPYAREQLMTNQVGLYDELKVPYNATITMFGNNLFVPGARIFVNPSSIGFGSPSDKASPSYRLGLGGYYTILRVVTTITNGAAETVLECTFGDHARASGGLTSAVPVADSVLGETPSQVLSATPDSVAQISSTPSPRLRSAQSSVTRTGLENIRDSSGSRVLSVATADALANDYLMNPNDDSLASNISGVISRTSNSDGSVKYEVSTPTGIRVVRIDSSGGVSSSAITKESDKSIERLAREKEIGTNPRTIARDDTSRGATATEYTPPKGKGKT